MDHVKYYAIQVVKSYVHGVHTHTMMHTGIILFYRIATFTQLPTIGEQFLVLLESSAEYTWLYGTSNMMRMMQQPNISHLPE